jgi:hypothetical protein
MGVKVRRRAAGLALSGSWPLYAGCTVSLTAALHCIKRKARSSDLPAPPANTADPGMDQPQLGRPGGATALAGQPRSGSPAACRAGGCCRPSARTQPAPSGPDSSRQVCSAQSSVIFKRDWRTPIGPNGGLAPQVAVDDRPCDVSHADPLTASSLIYRLAATSAGWQSGCLSRSLLSACFRRGPWVVSG